MGYNTWQKIRSKFLKCYYDSPLRFFKRYKRASEILLQKRHEKAVSVRNFNKNFSGIVCDQIYTML